MKTYLNIYNLTIIAFFIISCGNSDKTNQEKSIMSEPTTNQIVISKAQFDQSGMVLGKLEEKPFPEIIKVTGMIDVPPQNKAVVSAIAGGVVKNTQLLIGDQVKKGQALLTIENPEFITMQQEYLEVKEQLTYLRSEYERQQMLIKEKITSQKKFLKSESEYKTAQARYKGLRKQLSLLNISITGVEKGNITSVATIFAPINGSITKMSVTRGMHVSPATELLEIIDNNHIHLELSVFEKDIMKIRKGQTIQFTIPEISTKVYDASVYLIGTSIDERRTIRVHGHLNKDENHNFLTGMYVNADIITTSKLIKALPETAVVEVEEKYYVMLLESDMDDTYSFTKKEVTKGSSYNNFTALPQTSMFKDSAIFLTKGGFSLIVE